MSEDEQLTLDEVSDSNDPPKAAYLENSAFGDIPGDWTWEESSEHLEYIESGISDPQNKDGDGVPVSRIETIADGVVNHQKVGYVNEDDDYSGHRLNPDDLLFSNINSRKEIGKTAIYQGEKPLFHGMNLLRIRYNSSDFNPYFAYYIYDSPMAQDVFFRMSKAAVGQSSINQSQMERLFLPHPPLQEQRKIATVLHNVDQAIQKTEEIVERIKKLEQGLMQDLFRRGIEQSETKELRRIGEVPQHWEIISLGDVCTEITDGTHKSPPTIENGYPYVTSQNIRDWGFDLTDLKYIAEEDHSRITSRCNPEPNDILYVKDGANTGNVNVNTLDFDFSLLSSVALIKPDRDRLKPWFLKYLLSWPKFRQLVLSQMSGTGISRLTISKLEKTDILLPSVKEQEQIIEILDTHYAYRKNQRKYRSQLQRSKQGLMQDLLSGKVRTTDTNIEVPDEIAQHG